MTRRPGPPRRPLAFLLALTIGWLAGVAPSGAEDLWLVAGVSFPKPGEPVDVGMHQSDVFPSEPIAWRPDRTRQFFLVDAAGRLDLKDGAYRGNPPMARVTLRSPGTAVFALVSETNYTEIPAAAFDAYLAAEGHAALVKARRAARAETRPGRERSTRFAKTLAHAGVPGTAAPPAIGLRLEIIPEAQPALVRPGAALPVRVVLDGRPFAGGRVCADDAAGHAGADGWCGTLDAAGRAAVPIQATGWHMVRTAHIGAVRGDARADWESLRTALTFEIPKKPPKMPPPAAAPKGTPR